MSGMGVSLQEGVSVQEGGLCPAGVSVQGVSVQRGSLSRGFLSTGGSMSTGGSLSGRPFRTVMCGRYASYWKAFLLFLVLLN